MSLSNICLCNSMWVTLHILWKAVSLHLFLWPTVCEWHCTFCERQSKSHCIFSYDQQGVSWHCTFCERHSHCIFSYDQQQVSDIAHFVKGSLIASFPMTNSKWVTLHIVWKVVSLCMFSYDQQRVSDIGHFVKSSLIASFPMTNREWVDIAHFVKGSLIASFPMINSMWVTLNILWKAVTSLHVFLWPTGSEWHCTFCEGSLIVSFPMTNREWVTLHILWKAVSLCHFLWPTVCEWHCIFCERLMHLFPMTNSK